MIPTFQVLLQIQDFFIALWERLFMCDWHRLISHGWWYFYLLCSYTEGVSVLKYIEPLIFIIVKKSVFLSPQLWERKMILRNDQSPSRTTSYSFACFEYYVITCLCAIFLNPALAPPFWQFTWLMNVWIVRSMHFGEEIFKKLYWRFQGQVSAFHDRNWIQLDFHFHPSSRGWCFWTVIVRNDRIACRFSMISCGHWWFVAVP